MTDYWKKWKEALNSLKKPIESALSELEYESMERLRKLKKELPDIDFSALEIESARRFKEAIEINRELPTPEFQQSEEKLTLREHYGFKPTNYDD